MKYTLAVLLGLFLALPGQTIQVPSRWHVDYLQLPAAHKKYTGKGVKVGVIDSGCDTAHPRFAGKTVKFPDERLAPNDPTNDAVGHGSWVVSILLDAAPDAEVTLYQVFDNFGRAMGPWVANAFDAARMDGMDIIVLSGGATGEQRLMREAVTRALNDGLMLFVAAGNFRPGVVGPLMPGSMTGVFQVGSIGRDGKPSTFSVPGPNVVCVMPGEYIWGPDAGAKTSSPGRGTSASTPLAAGVAALWVEKIKPTSLFKTNRATVFHHLIETTSVDVGEPGRDDKTGYGVLDVTKILGVK